MACGHLLTKEEVIADATDKAMNIVAKENQTAEESRAFLTSVRGMFAPIKVKYDDAPVKVQKALIAESGDLIERYGIIGTNVVVAWNRITDAVSKKFKYTFKDTAAAKAINDRPDSVIAATVGTKTHEALRSLAEWIIEQDDTGMLVKNKDNARYGAEIKDLETIRKELGVTPKIFENLIKITKKGKIDYSTGLPKIIRELTNLQMQINPDGKVQIFTEQVVYNPKEDLMGTADLLAVFSDNSFAHLDYKTMSAKSWDHYEYNYATHQKRITDANWIPEYKYHDFSLQLPTTNRILQQKFGLGKNRISRVIPIQLETALKENSKDLPTGHKLTDKIVQLNMGADQNKYLSPIPVQELSGNDKLDKALKQVMDSRRNLEIDLENTTDPNKKEILLRDIGRKRMLINKLIVDRDITYLAQDLNMLLKRYFEDGDYSKMVDFNSSTIDGIENPNYISTEKFHDIIMELENYKVLVDTGPIILKDLNVDKQAMTEYMSKLAKVSFSLNMLIGSMKESYQDRVLSSTEKKAMEDNRTPNWWQRWFRPLSEQTNMAFRKFSQWIQEANDKRRIRANEMLESLKKIDLEVEDWARRNNMSRAKVNDLLYEEKTGNLIARHTKEFYQDLKEAQKNNNTKWLDEHLVLRKDAKERYEQYKETFMASSPTTEEQKRWLSIHDFNNIKANPQKYYYYYEINPNISTDSKYYSEKFKMLKQKGNEPLLKYWDYWNEKMGEAFDLLDMRGSDRLPTNFLPWIRANTLEMVMQDGWNFENIRESVTSIFQVREDDIGYGDPTITGKIDPVTGERKLTVPKYFINPLKDNNGRVATDLKSRDLSKSLYIFYNMALDYHYLKHEVEPKVDALKDTLAEVGVKMDKIGDKEVKTKDGFFARIVGKKLDVNDMLDKWINYHLYGIKIQDTKKETAKTLLALKKYQTNKEIAWAPLAPIGNFIQVTANAFFTGLNGYYYSREQGHAAAMMGMNASTEENNNKYKAIVYFIEPSLGKKDVHAKHLMSRTIFKIASSDTAFWGYRKAEEYINNNTLIAMMQNYGYDQNGNIKRLANLPKGTSSLFEKSKIVNGKLVIEGIVDEKGNINMEKYTQLRNMAVGVAREIKGQMSQEDIYLAQSGLFMNLMMAFKSWLPGMADARMGEIRYNPNTNAIIVGKYRAVFDNMDKGQKHLAAFIGLEVIPRLAKFIALSPIIALTGNKNLYKVNEHRARMAFEKYKNDFRNDPAIQQMTLEDFIDYSQGQIRSTAAELSIILAFMAALMALGTDWDDDGEPDFMKTWGGRTMFRIINRGRREIAFLINPSDWQSFLRTPVPLTGLVFDVHKWLMNTRDEAGDLIFDVDERTGMSKVIFGKNIGKDNKPVFYESLRFLSGHKLLKTVEIFEEQKKAET